MTVYKSLSIAVPAAGCVNDCKFCVSKMKDDWKQFGVTDEHLTKEVIKDTIEKGIEHGIKSVIITGTIEPLQNMPMVKLVCEAFREINPANVMLEIQTSLCYGAMTIPYIRKLNEWGVDLIAISIASLDDKANWDIMGVPKNRYFPLRAALNYINEKTDLLTRLCCNVNDKFLKRFDDIFKLNVEQLTIRKLYDDGSDTSQTKWIKDNTKETQYMKCINDYVNNYGIKINSSDWMMNNGVSVRFDEDCMGKQDESRYLVLRPNGKIYQGWDGIKPLNL